jgi:hypothetical protein
MRGIAITALPLAPGQYNAEYMNRLLKQISVALAKIEAVGPVLCGSDLSGNIVGHPVSGLTILNVPTSPTGLPSGSVWSDSGTLKIVS